MKKITFLAMVVSCSLLNVSLSSADEVVKEGKFVLSRIGQLIRYADIEVKDKDFLEKLLGVNARSEIDIENLLSKRSAEVYRVWTFTEGVQRVRIMAILEDGSVEAYYKSNEDEVVRQVLTKEVFARIKNRLDIICLSSLDFRDRPNTRFEGELTFIVERLNGGGYAWAIRPLGTCSDKAFKEIDEVVGDISKILK